MESLYRKVLTLAGYDSEPTKDNVIKCFLDYVDHGAFGNLDYDEAKQDIENEEITMEQICANMLRVCR